ncbi:MAG: thioredoxin family protein [Planctomycetota bacterium]
MFAATMMIAVSSSSSSATTTYADAYKTAQTEGKPMLILVSADYCPACKLLKKETTRAAELGRLPDVVITVVNKDEQPQLAKSLLDGKLIPQLVTFSPTDKGWKQMRKKGYQTQYTVKKLASDAVRLTK